MSDISSSMIEWAKAADPSGDYQLVAAGDFRAGSFDLGLSEFAFDAREQRRAMWAAP